MTQEKSIPLKKSAFEAALRELTKEAERSTENLGSYQSDTCERCVDCMFTTSSKDCFKCTYCTGCTQCTGCTHCVECEHVHNSSYCTRSSHVTNSSYVVLSTSCHGCVFCFGCVGLVNKEFHILNQPFKRDVYFKMLESLEAAFGVKRRA